MHHFEHWLALPPVYPEEHPLRTDRRQRLVHTVPTLITGGFIQRIFDRVEVLNDVKFQVAGCF